MSKIIKHLVIIIVLLVLSQQIFAVIFFDVDEFNFLDKGEKVVESKKGIRVCIFDTYNQWYANINYFPYPSSSESDRQLQLPLYWPGENNVGGVHVYYNGNIILVNYSQPYGYIVRTKKGQVFIQNGNNQELKGELFKSRTFQVKDGATIAEELNNFSGNKRPGDDLKIIFRPHSGPINVTFKKVEDKEQIKVILDDDRGSFENISSTKEKSILGELATECTMLVYGYTKLPSVNKSNHGYDGVFINNINNQLFFTESKCYGPNTSKTAETVLSDTLEGNNFEKKMKALKNHIETKQIIEDFL